MSSISSTSLLSNYLQLSLPELPLPELDPGLLELSQGSVPLPGVEGGQAGHVVNTYLGVQG